MQVKLLVGPAASGKSTYTREHKGKDDIVAFTIEDELHIEDQSIAYRLQRLTGMYLALMDRIDVKKFAKAQLNGKRFVDLCGIYLNEYDKELTIWIESKTISQEAIDVLADSYKHRFELIRFERDNKGENK